MKFKGMLLAVAIVLCTISPKESKAVGELGQAVCSSVSSILSAVPSSVGYLNGWKLKCSFTKGCWFEYKCKSLELADEMEKGLTMVCNAITSYGPGFFPGSSLTQINGDLLSIKGEMDNISSIVSLSSPENFDPVAANNSMNSIRGSLNSIQSLMPSIPGQSSKWVKKKSKCKKAEGGASDSAYTPSVGTTASYNTIQNEVEDQSEAEVLSTCGTEPSWIPEYRNPAWSDYQSDLSSWNNCKNQCGIDYSDPFEPDFILCDNSCGNKPVWKSGYENPAKAQYNSDKNTYWTCQENVTTNFNYNPSSNATDLQNQAISDATSGASSSATDLINNSTDVCIPQSKVNTMPPAAANNLDPNMICP